MTLPDGGWVNIRCTGQGSPPIILTAGAGEQSLTWHAIQTALSRMSEVCAWDRPGFGFSDPNPAAQDATHLTGTLEATLIAARIRPPYLLVGHSLGSFETLLFAFRHPRNVAGIVLIDPAGPYQDDRLRKAAPQAYAALDIIQKAQLLDLARCIDKLQNKPSGSEASSAPDDCLSAPIEGYPSELNRVLIQIDSNIDGQKDMLSLLENVYSDTDSRELMQAWRSLGDMPLTVLTAGEPPPLPVTGTAKAQMPALQAAWSKMHDDMAHLSKRGINSRVAGSGHYIYQQRPQIVLDAIADVLRSTRRADSRDNTGAAP